jgi:hypothetical protein
VVGAPRALSRTFELVAKATNGEYRHGVTGIHFHLRAEALDVHVQRLGVTVLVTSPHSVDQRVSRHHATRIGH